MRLISLQTVARLVDASPKSIRRWIESGAFPAPTHVLPCGRGENASDSRLWRWSKVVVEAWMTVQIAAPVKGKNQGSDKDQARPTGTS